MLRSMTNTFIAILVFITLFLVGSLPHANAASCPIGDTPSLKWPLGTSYIASACVNGCRAVEGSAGQNTWTCNTSAGYCTGYFTTTGDSCSGSDNTNGSCDANGNCTGSGGTGGGTNGNGLVTVPMLPYSVIQGTDLSKAFEHTVKSLNNQNEFVRREVESLKILSENKLQGLYNLFRQNTDAVKSSQQHITDTRNESVRQTLELYKANDKLQQMIIKLSSGTGSDNAETYLKNISNAISNHFIGNSYSALAHLDNTVSRLDSVKRTLDDNHNSFTNFFAYRMDSLEKALSGIGGGGDVDLSGIESGINSLNTGIDSVKSGIDNLNGLLSGEGLSKPGIGSGVDFGEHPLYGEDAITKLNTEITDLQKQYSEKTKEFKKLFSFDITKLESGQYKDHSLTFKFANGATTKFTSGVFPALVDNAALISSVILFLAAFAGIKTIMGERE
ncbi:hypothetical protein [Vibrio cholerae]|uniref:hypothetical protein n=1 Tax=Vibrio cholerae TaxID=666 RepID=UPI0011F0E6AD|nr:hypothetical protein [Vibrio cholerae]KAA1004794.1 hypothetical protein F0H40_18460 [Vibrio cholerae]KAA1012707.1 hypothetical protein F0H43_18525 [Vibrio cholerae]KAA1019309.1 hypothetical protein F0H42_18430 [Vibrio cholerae]KAA1022449.1 hypothetical protein F0H44_18415 [Vibrio cholerae]KAA1028709.1 hypothetical protein F0H47_18465 [Vibrio cholerae]